MGRIAALVTLVVVLAGCGSDPEQVAAGNVKSTVATTTGNVKDVNFLKALDIGKVPYAVGTDAILQGRAACVFLSAANGGSYVGAIQGVEEHNPTFSHEQLGFFVGAAVQIFCPDEVSALPTS